MEDSRTPDFSDAIGKVTEDFIEYVKKIKGNTKFSDIRDAAVFFSLAYIMSCLVSGSCIVIFDLLIFVAACFIIIYGLKAAQKWLEEKLEEM